MPVVAVVGGIASAMGGAAAFSAAAGFTLANVAAGLSVVGGIASALGGITGNKKLMKFGMIAGLGGAAIGGIGSLMNGASASTSATTLATGDSGLGLAANAAGEGLQGASMGLDGIGTSSGSTTGMLGSGIGDGLANLNTGAPSMVAETANAANATSGATSAAPASYALTDPAAINTAGGGGFAPGTSSVMSEATNQLRVPAPPNPGDTGSSMFSRFGSAIKNNPELAKTATGMLSGLGQSYMQGQQQKEQERIANERRARFNASIMGQRARF